MHQRQQEMNLKKRDLELQIENLQKQSSDSQIVIQDMNQQVSQL
jgi:hypothetical protein